MSARRTRWGGRYGGMLWLAVLLGLVTACAGQDAAARSEATPRPAELRERMEDVAERRARIDEEIDEAMTILRRADDAMARSRRAPLIGQGLEEAVATRERLAALTVEDGRRHLRELAARIDETRTVVGEMQRATTEEELSWQAELDAQDSVLQALREHLAAGDALLQLIDRHRPSYDRVLDVLESFDETEHEDAIAAARAVDRALAEVREPVELARDEIDDFFQRRRVTARAVNEAAADAATVAEQRS